MQIIDLRPINMIGAYIILISAILLLMNHVYKFRDIYRKKIDINIYDEIHRVYEEINGVYDYFLRSSFLISLLSIGIYLLCW